MPINSLTLDPKNPAFKDALAECKPGDTGKQFLVTLDVVQHGNKFVGDVTGVEYPPEAESEEEDMGESGEEEMPEKEMPMKKGPKVAIILGMGKKA